MIKVIAERIKSFGGRALLVGGTVRDEHLGVVSKDFDVEVYGLTPDQLEYVLNTLGQINATGKRFGVFKMSVGDYDFDFSLPRTDSKVAPGKRGFVTTPNKDMDRSEAARRRDFTMNSMWKDPLTGEIGDPFNGRIDLDFCILRCTDPTTFPDDPTRVLRGMRFCGQCDLVAVTETVDLCRSMLPHAGEIAREMVWVEWEKWATRSTKPSRGLEFLLQTGWITLYPELMRMVGVEQHPIHHPEGTVWNHTLQVIDNLAGQGLVEVFAGLCHDMGKAQATLGEGESITSHGHEKWSAEQADSFLKSIGMPQKYIEQVVALVANHMFDDRQVSEKAVRKLATRLDPASVRQLSKLVLADRMGRRPLVQHTVRCMRCTRPLTDPESIKRGIGPVCLKKWQLPKVLTIAQELACEDAKPKPMVNGRDLIKHKIMKPGPQMGEFLRFLFACQLDGVFEDLEEGIAFAKLSLDYHHSTPFSMWKAWRQK